MQNNANHTTEPNDEPHNDTIPHHLIEMTGTEVSFTQVPLLDLPTKPREEWDEDERLDRRPKTASIRVLVVPVGAAPYLQTIGNNLEALQAVVGGLITTFETGVEGVVGVANDEAIVDSLPLNRLIPATGSGIFGTFFLAGDGINFHSLSQEEIARCHAVFETPLLPAIPVDAAANAEVASTAESGIPTGTNPNAIEVCVFAPDELPYCTRIEATPATGYLPALQRLIAGELIEQVQPFRVAAFDTQIFGLVGLCHAGNVDDTVLSINADHFPPNRRILHLPSMFYGTFIVAATTMGSELSDYPFDQVPLLSLTPELLEKALDTLAPELDSSLFEQVMHSHSRGAVYMGNWD